jgi:hypothetical protein
MAAARFGEALAALNAAASAWASTVNATAVEAARVLAATRAALETQSVEIDLLRATLRAHQRRE